MTTIQKTVTIDADRKLSIDVPQEVPSGMAEVTITISPCNPGKVRAQPWSHLAGSLADSPAFAGDPVAIQRKLRDEWQ